VFNEYIRQSGNRRQLQSLSNNRFGHFQGVIDSIHSPEKLSKREEKSKQNIHQSAAAIVESLKHVGERETL
jgi:hypothetical protein